MSIRLLVFVCIWSAALAAPAVFTPGKWYSIMGKSAKWEITPGRRASGAVGSLMYEPTRNETGWDVLNAETYATASDADQAYALGYLEAAVTQPAMWDAFRNFAKGTSYTPNPKVAAFIKTNLEWMAKQVQANPNSTYWAHVGIAMANLEGLAAGYAAYAGEGEKLTYDDWLYYNMQWELGDYAMGVGVQTYPEDVRPPIGAHCSVLIKKTPTEGIIGAHVTWEGFHSMLRVYKHITTSFTVDTFGHSMSFSSYPGALVSGDDWYVTNAGLVVTETTNGVYNMSLYHDYVKTDTVPYWIRILVANRMSPSGKTWHETFQQYNSGSYNNQWMVWTQPDATLYVGEQIPGFYVYEDMTWQLEKGWQSYNIPFFPKIYNLSGYVALYNKYGNEYSHDKCARGQIFTRDKHNVVDLPTLKVQMRYNQWQTDPLSLQDACRGISARCDLNAPWAKNTLNSYSAFGGTDCKMTSAALLGSRTSHAISGPTWNSNAIFHWGSQWANVPHHGHPEYFAFDWQTMSPAQ